MSFCLGVEVRLKSNYVVASTVAGLAALKLLVRATLSRPLVRAPQSEYALDASAPSVQFRPLRANQTPSFRRM